jgi:hypothetical protein
MTEEQFGMLAAAIHQLNRGFMETARHIVWQQAEIGAIQSILGLGDAPVDEDRARDETLRKLKDGFPATPMRRCRRVSRRFNTDSRSAG